ncbi:MAG TPA: transcription antitermination factor NusB [Cytophagaceae bacterium]
MQALYALKQSEISNYHSGFEQIAEDFAPHLNSMEKPDYPKLELDKKIASDLYEKSFTKGEVVFSGESDKIKKSVESAIQNYYHQIQKDKKHFSRLMMEDIEKIYDTYLYILKLLPEISDYVRDEEEERKSKQLTVKISSPGDYKFKDNRITRLLRSNKNLELHSIKRNVRIPRDFVRSVYKDAIKNDEEYGKYKQLQVTDFETDKNIVLHIVKNIIFKDKNLQFHFEESDLNWVENKSIIRSMVVKTIKNFDENSNEEIPLLEISANWDEDKAFFQDLYDYSVKEEAELEKIVSEKIKNWDIERVATVDTIILKMALAEMLHFASIPVKVTINEYIELSKLYSTPKSKQFINGILDAIAADLTSAGKIRKSGRGLIDNK